MPISVPQALIRLESLGDERVRARNRKRGAGDTQFGVDLGDVRTLAKEIRTDHDLALELWATDIGEAHGVYRDYPTPSGCASAFASSWIGEIVRRRA